MNTKLDDEQDDGFHVSIDYILTGVSSWLIPGSGHWLLGYRLRGAILGVGILGLFWFGESALANNMAVSRKTSPIFYGCQMGNGLSTLVSEQLWGKPHRPNDPRLRPDYGIPRYYHFGILFTTVSGLLNMLAVLHVLDPRTWRRARADQRAPREGPDARAGDGFRDGSSPSGAGTGATP